MLEAILAMGILGGFFILRGIAATWLFFYILPEGDRCPSCDSVTVRVQSTVWNKFFPKFRTSWCMDCNWHGLLREGPLTPVKPAAELARKD